MQKLSTLLVAAAAIVAVPVNAGILIPVVPYPGSIATEPFDINDNNIIAGGYATDDDLNFHAFFGTLDGQYTSFNGKHYGGYVQANSINIHGWITGIYRNSETCTLQGQCEFVRKPDGTFVTLMKDGAPLEGYARQMIANEKFIADFGDLTGGQASYLGRKTKYQKSLDIDLTDPRGRGLNSKGTIVGRFSNAQGNQSGFILQGGVVSVVDYPDDNAVNTALYGINDAGLISGYWDTGEPDNIAHGFILDSTNGTFHQLDVQGAQQYTYLNGINNEGFVTVRSDVGNFIYCPRKKSQCPKGGIALSLGRAVQVPLQKMALHQFAGNAKAAIVRGRSEDRGEVARPLSSRH